VGKAIHILNPRDVTVVLSIASDYDQKKGNSDNGYSFKGEDPHNTVLQRRRAAESKSYAQLYNTHTRDFSEIYTKFQVNWGVVDNDISTLDRWSNYYHGGEDPTLEWLQYNFGRYMLLSSSRVGTLPANLQGLWSNRLNPAWSADYHTDINLQMNYWLAQTTGLSVTLPPLFDYITENWMTRGSETAKIHYNSAGYVAHEELTIFGSTGPRCCGGYAIYPLGHTWMTSTAWDHFDYTQDVELLRSTIYPILKGSALFWLDYLAQDGATQDGSLVHYPCQSPEHGQITFGCTHSQHLIWENLHNVLKSYEIAQDTDVLFIRRVEDTLQNLDLGLRVGSWGQLQEWKMDWDDPEEQHRHISHLVGVWPGYMVSSVFPQYLEAAKVSLIHRGYGRQGAAAGWEKVWRAGVWARLRNATASHDELRWTITDNMQINLMSLYPLGDKGAFQIDSNFGFTASATAMIFQDPDTMKDGRSYALFQLLPTLPEQWSTGSIKGLKGRGGFSLNFQWKDGLVVGDVTVTAENTMQDRVVHIQTDAFKNKMPQVTCGGVATPSKVFVDTLVYKSTPKTTCVIRL